MCSLYPQLGPSRLILNDPAYVSSLGGSVSMDPIKRYLVNDNFVLQDISTNNLAT